MKDRLIVDLDDTLVNINHRKKYYGKDWDTYNLLLVKDTLNLPVYRLVCAMSSSYKIIILTGRLEIYRELTNEWLKKNVPFDYELVCKPVGDERSSVEYKKEWLTYNYISHNDYVIDDRHEIESFCSKNGIGFIKPVKPK